uniref:Uncharacterized protein n=1 Tax=Candidatus Nitrotoga fabula TaxID=2182327 RepID=A0A2X0QWB5_9PROT|nr:protein of unknown function [Candidatus Nitrotoga fabula]
MQTTPEKQPGVSRAHRLHSLFNYKYLLLNFPDSKMLPSRALHTRPWFIVS